MSGNSAEIDAARQKRNARIEEAYEAVARLNAALRRVRAEPGVGCAEIVPTHLNDGSVDLRIVLERDAATPSSLARVHEGSDHG